VYGAEEIRSRNAPIDVGYAKTIGVRPDSTARSKKSTRNPPYQIFDRSDYTVPIKKTLLRLLCPRQKTTCRHSVSPALAPLESPRPLALGQPLKSSN
jgi:hypothetical protein